MVSVFDGYNHILRFNKGESLRESLIAYLKEQDIQGGWVSGIGSALSVELGYYNVEKKEYQWQKFDKVMEVTGLQGTVALDESGQPVMHVHGTFSDDKYQTVGGHVKDLTVGGTLELFIHRTYKPLHRKTDPETALQLLDL